MGELGRQAVQEFVSVRNDLLSGIVEWKDKQPSYTTYQGGYGCIEKGELLGFSLNSVEETKPRVDVDSEEFKVHEEEIKSKTFPGFENKAIQD